MDAVLAMLSVQCLLGALDNLWHHELAVDLPHRPGAAFEMLLHALREFFYVLILAVAAWQYWQGAWALVFAAVLAAEILVTLRDFIEEDRTRRLPGSERVLHTILALNYGATLALWAPQLMRQWQAPTTMAMVDHGAWSWLLSAGMLGALAWGLRDLLAAWRLAHPSWHRRPLRAGSNAAPRTVLVTGGTGFIGSALVRALVERGDRVIVLSRKPYRAWDRFGPAVEIVGKLAELDEERRVDAIVNLAGAPIAGLPWTARRRRTLVGSRIGVTAELTQLVARLRRRPEVLVNASAIGWYGEHGEELLDEDGGPQQRFVSELCRRWERAALGVGHWGVRVCCLRIGLVLGREGGVLPPMLRSSRLGLGAVLGDGAQWLSWVHLNDLLRLILLLLERPELNGAFNATAPEPVRQREFAAALAAAHGGRARLRVPAALLRALAGEMSDLFLLSQRVVPRKALDAGFRFEHPQLPQALAALLAEPGPGAEQRRVTA
jgi:uncharacterized protein (TIGR01777 family)